jgi:membrane protein required for colicin V production
MTIFDTLVLIIVVALLVRGVWTGFIRQIAFVLALILGFIFAATLTGPLARIARIVIDNPLPRFFLVYMLLFGLGALAVILAGRSLQKLAETANLSWLDRALGGILGLFKALFICCLLFLLAAFIWPPNRDYLKTTLFYPVLSRGSLFLMSFVKDDELRYHFFGQDLLIRQHNYSTPPVLPLPVPPSEPVRRHSI